MWVVEMLDVVKEKVSSMAGGPPTTAVKDADSIAAEGANIYSMARAQLACGGMRRPVRLTRKCCSWAREVPGPKDSKHLIKLKRIAVREQKHVKAFNPQCPLLKQQPAGEGSPLVSTLWTLMFVCGFGYRTILCRYR